MESHRYTQFCEWSGGRKAHRSIQPSLSRLVSPETVEAVAMNLWNPCRQAVREMLPLSVQLAQPQQIWVMEELRWSKHRFNEKHKKQPAACAGIKVIRYCGGRRHTRLSTADTCPLSQRLYHRLSRSCRCLGSTYSPGPGRRKLPYQCSTGTYINVGSGDGLVPASSISGSSTA